MEYKKEHMFFCFFTIVFFRFYQYFMFKFLNIPLVFYDTTDPIKLYVLEICIFLSLMTSFYIYNEITL